jgi:hypothetical protein
VDEADLTLFQMLVNAAKHTSSMKVLHMLLQNSFLQSSILLLCFVWKNSKTICFGFWSSHFDWVVAAMEF